MPQLIPSMVRGIGFLKKTRLRDLVINGLLTVARLSGNNLILLPRAGLKAGASLSEMRSQPDVKINSNTQLLSIMGLYRLVGAIPF